MADTYQYVAKDASGQPKYGWDGQKWVSIAQQIAPGSIQKKPGGPILSGFQEEHPLRAIPATILQSFGIDPAKVEGAKSTIDALKYAGGQVPNEIGEQMFESLAKAGPLAPVHMLGKGIIGIEQGIKEGSQKAYQSYKNGDRFGMTEGLTRVASSLGQLALLKESKVPEKTAELAGKGVRAVARAPIGIGPVAERFGAESRASEVAANEAANREAARQVAEKNHEIATRNVQAVSEARQTSEEAVRKIEDQNAKSAADYEQEKNRIDAQYKRDMQKFEQARSGQSLTSQGKGARPSATSEASGATRARLSAWSDKVGEIASKTQDNLRTAFNKRYDAFRNSLGENPQVNWTPVQEAVSNAEKNILQGSPESLTLFRNIMKEGPQLDEATVFRSSQKTEAAANLKEMMQSRFMDEATKRRIEAQLTAQGVPPGAVRETGTITEGLKIPHKDAWGYAQELNAKLHGAHLPSDVYRAVESVKEANDAVLQEAADAKNAGGAWKQIQKDYSEYAQRFLDKDSPAYKLLNATNPEDRLLIISGKEGQNLIDILHKYRGFGGDTEIAGKVRALRAAGSKIADELPEPKRGAYPEPPQPKPLPTESAYPKLTAPETLDPSKLKSTEPFDPNEWRRQRLREYQQRLAERQPPSQWQLLQLPYFRAMSRLYSNPAFVKLILGIK